LKEGDIFVAARVIRDLTWHGQSQGLTKRDTQLVQRAEDLVATELSLVEGIEVQEAVRQLQTVLEEAIDAQNAN
jgi:RNA polymerase-interacting CarD/CdnL/TRCF family regulator